MTTTMDDAFQTDLRQATAARRDWAVDQVCQLIAARTELGNEAPGQAIMADLLAQCGLQVETFDVDPAAIRDHPGFAPPPTGDYAGRPNVVGTHRPRAAEGRSLILNGHIDVVPPSNDALWSRPAFQPWTADGRIFGRGAADMKSGLVANALAIAALSDLGYAPAAPVHLQSVIEEECTGNGTLACIARGCAADAVIIPEPFGQTIMWAQMGVMWVTVEVSGKPTHVLDAGAGLNAIEACFTLFEALRRLEAKWNEDAARHPAYAGEVHPVNFNLGRIEGGDWASTVPARATMQVRAGFLPGIDPADAARQIEARIVEAAAGAGLSGARVKVSYGGHRATGHVSDRKDPLFGLLAEAHRSVTGSPARMLASTATTDARFFPLYADTPATRYGPVGGDLHGIDEWVSIDSMLEVGTVLATFIAGWCGLERHASTS